MTCDKCNKPSVKVLETRHRADGAIYRRRLCVCGHRWSTVEQKEAFDRLQEIIALRKQLDDIGSILRKTDEPS